MTSRDKNAEVRSVAAELSERMDELSLTVAALAAILTRPEPEPGAADERLVAP